jgi:hypothetical protein
MNRSLVRFVAVMLAAVVTSSSSVHAHPHPAVDGDCPPTGSERAAPPALARRPEPPPAGVAVVGGLGAARGGRMYRARDAGGELTCQRPESGPWRCRRLHLASARGGLVMIAGGFNAMAIAGVVMMIGAVGGDFSPCWSSSGDDFVYGSGTGDSSTTCESSPSLPGVIAAGAALGAGGLVLVVFGATRVHRFRVAARTFRLAPLAPLDGAVASRRGERVVGLSLHGSF